MGIKPLCTIWSSCPLNLSMFDYCFKCFSPHKFSPWKVKMVKNCGFLICPFLIYDFFNLSQIQNQITTQTVILLLLKLVKVNLQPLMIQKLIILFQTAILQLLELVKVNLQPLMFRRLLQVHTPKGNLILQQCHLLMRLIQPLIL